MLVLAFLGLAAGADDPDVRLGHRLAHWRLARAGARRRGPPGDTLYGIAAELAEPGEIRAMVHRIQELNSLPGGQISEGQKLAVPRG